MATIIPATLSINVNEPAYLLVEMNLKGPPVNGTEELRRWQIIYVNRGDKISEWRKDLGPAKAFIKGQFRIPAEWVHTVGELMEIADYLRNDIKSDADRILGEERERVEEQMLPQFYDMAEALRKERRRSSQFGPGSNKQRNG